MSFRQISRSGRLLLSKTGRFTRQLPLQFSRRFGDERGRGQTLTLRLCQSMGGLLAGPSERLTRGPEGINVLARLHKGANTVRQSLHQPINRSLLIVQLTRHDPRRFEVKAPLETVRLGNHTTQNQERTFEVLGMGP
jgi:hypothetical protein